MDKILLKNGRVLDPGQNLDQRADVLIKAGKIKKVGVIEPQDDFRVIDCENKLIIPGAVDLHVHLRDMDEAEKETIKTGTQAALRGGVTYVLAMPNTKPRLDSPESIQKYKELIEKEAQVEVGIAGAITKDLKGKSLGSLEKYPAFGIRFITDDGFDVNDEKLLKKAYEMAAQNDLIVMTHPEMDSIGKDGVMNEGKISQKLGMPGQPNEKEWKAVERAIKLAKETGCRAHITHVTTKESVTLIREAKQETKLLTCDATPHHLSFTEEVVELLEGFGKVNPPLRSEEDRQELLEAVRDGTIDCIVTDHAPHAEFEKEKGLKEAPFGFSGLEILIPATLTELHFKGGMNLNRVIALLTAKPARIAGLMEHKIEPGKPASLTVVDLNLEKKVNRNKFASMGKATPFHDQKLRGWPIMTISGTNVFEI